MKTLARFVLAGLLATAATGCGHAYICYSGPSDENLVRSVAHLVYAYKARHGTFPQGGSADLAKALRADEPLAEALESRALSTTADGRLCQGGFHVFEYRCPSETGAPEGFDLWLPESPYDSRGGESRYSWKNPAETR